MEKRYITVSTLNRYLKNKFDTDPNIQRVSLKGEISNFKGHTRGHLYFTLKDEEGRINAVMFSFNASKLTFVPEDGMKVLVTGRVSVYPPTGSYQIYVEEMESDGLGNLYLMYEALKKELAEKGLFDAGHKKQIPKYPHRIGIVTAPTGAAIKDILSTIKRRYPICETIIFPCLVQGELAKDDIVKAINEAEKYDLDVLIVGRGGGSYEDLWAFNEKNVAYAIYNCTIPVISAVGHEIDFTIADFVADLRAPTPTGAAEMAVPNMADLLTLLSNFALVEKMCKVLKKDEELAEKYQMEISYFERTFFENAKGRAETESNAYFIASRLENLLRAPSIRTILCNRYNNINFDDVLKNGKITFVCTRRGESGKVAHKAFGLFFLLSLQHAILKRPGNEKTRIPHFLYIDEFPDFLSKDTEAMFTLYRKYRVATTISAQSISQFDPNADKDNFNSVVLGNCQNKIYTGGSSPINELKWWSDEIGNWKQWQFTQSYDGAKDKMGSTLSGVKYDYKTKLPAGRLQTLGTNHCAYKILNDGGKPVIGEGVCSRLASKHKEKHQSKKYNFAKYSTGTGDFDDTENSNKSTKFNPKKLNFKDSDDEYNPVQNASTKYSFDEEGAIVINLKNNE